MPPDPTPATPEAEPDPVFGLHVALSAVVGAVCTVLWAVTGAGHFWPDWVWFGLVFAVAIHALIRQAALVRPRRTVAYRTAMLALVLAAVAIVAIWALDGGGPFWPDVPLLGLATAGVTLSLVVFRRRLPLLRRAELVERVDELTRTRSGALDVQAVQLRRIERDLHDGAQVRLVALSMQLGRAEQRLEGAGDPTTLELVRRARGEASAAIAELRDLARGIAPPVLADRGLGAAAEALGRRSASPVTVQTALVRRPAPVVESAAYFVIAEALTNASKHVPGVPVRVSVTQDDRQVVVTVADEGPGGADPGGSGLTGLRHRVEALDGRLLVHDAPEGGTIVRAELPCAS
jgi:signal transduction histidine kinase